MQVISKETLAVLGGGLLSGLLYASVMTGMPGAIIFANLAQLPLFVAGLGLGATASLAASVAGLVTAGVLGGALSAAIYVLVNAAPAILITRQMLLSRATTGGGVEWYPPKLLLGWLTGLGTTLFIAAAILFSGTQDGLEAYIREGLAQTLEQLIVDPDGTRAGAISASLAPFVPGIAVASWMVMTVINGTLAQGALVRFGRNLRPTPDIATLESSPWMAPALAAAGLLAWMGGDHLEFIGWNMVIILAVPFFFSGLGVVHALARRFSGGPLVLAMFYILLLMFAWPVIVVAALGLIDQWARFRRQWKGAGPGEEDE